jgi:membrane carboxypeptidase/penicillin-binding protein PbpC
MERRYSKQQILELYLNTINYGNGAYGAEAAAETYFQVHASDLSWAQATFLAGLHPCQRGRATLLRAEQTLLEPRLATAPGQDARQKRAIPCVTNADGS